MECIIESNLGFPTSTPSSVKRTQSPKIPCTARSHLGLSTPVPPPSECLAFIRRKGRYNPAKQSKLKNSLLAGVGFLELGNAGDFAANVWNEVPVPHFVMALMAVGGTVALALSYYAFEDARLSWRNIHLLRDERRYLQTQKAYYNSQDRQIARDIDCRLDVNFRETGTELVDRIGMDVMMGFGAVVVGIGTFMAIGGANPNVWRVSNLLSGYIGNVPAALYGMVNVAWSVYVWRRAHRHSIAGAKELKKADTVGQMLKNRTDTVKIHATMNGLTGIVAGAASLITATMWWGYVLLAPCIISSIFTNYLWRYRIGYDRPFVRQILRTDEVSLVEELEFVVFARQVLEEAPSESLSRLVADPESIVSTMEFIVKNDFFEDFCIRLLENTELPMALFGPSNETLIIDSQSLLTADDLSVCRLLKVAQACVSETGLTRFQYRERYLLETFGSYLRTPGVGATSEKAAGSALQVV
ncbi:hypothetical protein K440DRAFT_640728 [Wilcoxina mikolae CBS 423.85]|nr:hypothetical protein K440DRAFT_640728 [Wilcoxina mikolae CBS 423.85]